MSRMEKEIKKIVERNSKLNLKSAESRNKLVENIMTVVSKNQQEDTTDSVQIDVFKAIKEGRKNDSKRRERLTTTTLDDSLNPMSGFIKGSVPKVVNDNDIEDYYSDPKNKNEKPRPKKKVSDKPKKLSIEEIRKQEDAKKMSGGENSVESKPKPKKPLKVPAGKKRGFMSSVGDKKQSK